MVRTSQKQKILSRGEKNTQKNCTKTGLNDPDNHDGVISQLEPDTCSVKSSGPWEDLLRTKLVEVTEF